MLRTFLLSVLFASCAKIHYRSIQFSDIVKAETNRMHQMNIALLEYFFNEKKYMVNEFIANEYTAFVVENYLKRLPPDTDVKREMPEIIAAINPRIDARRDSLISVIQSQKLIVSAQLKAAYYAYEADMKSLQTYTINLQAINTALDNFITGPGNVSEKAILLAAAIQSSLR